MDELYVRGGIDLNEWANECSVELTACVLRAEANLRKSRIRAAARLLRHRRI